MASIEFHYRPSVRQKRAKGSVYIRVIHKRQTGSVTTPWKLYPEEWDRKENRIKCSGNKQRFPLLIKIEKEMAQTRSFLLGTIDQWEIQDHPFTTQDILAAYHRREGTGLFIDYVEKLSHELQISGQERTARGYLTTRNRLIGFVGNPHLQLKEITGLLVRRFEMFLEKEGKTPNTISFYMRNLRAIYNKAIAEGLLEVTPHNPFEYVYTGVCQTRKRALTASEMRLINDIDLFAIENTDTSVKEPSKQILIAQKLFLFCFLARGMSFVDMAFLRKEDIRQGVIHYKRKKTGQLLEVKVDTEMASIIRYFEKQTNGSPYVFPIICKPGENERLQYESALRTQNNRLKRLASSCKLSTINYQLSTHVARHSWATIAKEKNVPLVVISEGLGHTSEKTTSIYLGALNRNILDKAGEKVARAIKTAV